MSIFEAGMLICFGFAWPVNIYKSYKSRTAKGKSVFFLLIIILGYVFGIINKLLYNRDLVRTEYADGICGRLLLFQKSEIRQTAGCPGGM